MQSFNEILEEKLKEKIEEELSWSHYNKNPEEVEKDVLCILEYRMKELSSKLVKLLD